MNMIEYFKFFTDLWRFFRRHVENRNLEAAAKESMTLSKCYGETEFVCRMIVTIMDEIERITRRSLKK